MSVYTKTSSPHISSDKTISSFYWVRILAFFPLLLISCLIFQGDALRLVFVSLLGAALAEWGGSVLSGRSFNFWNGSCFFSAILFSMMLPPSAPTLFVFSAIFLAVFFTRELFGGLGHHFMDPALFARVILGSFFLQNTSAEIYAMEYNFISKSLTSLKSSLSSFLSDNMLSLIAARSDSLGTISVLFILIMGLFLVIKKIQKIEIPLIFLFSFSLSQMLFHKISLGVFFMPEVLLTSFFLFLDPVSSPSSRKGQRFFVLATGLLTGVFISNYENYFYVVSLIILLASTLSPWLDHLCSPKGKQVAV